eukprot:TRINITY_DN4039_c0_g2_i2.p1 TRINITY_DN4039_c0_g2~~TRINITY_DN4039_c0_g2_i2.p1  ORF type:complete len:350 (+),score=54.97 TRINITY_DN4039_c0_g2_i2:158-1207(+)
MASGVSEDELLARALQAAEQGPNPYLHSHFYAEDSFSEDDDADYNHTTNRPKKKPKRKAIHRSTSVANVSKNAPKPRQKSPSVSITAEPTQPKKTGTGQRGRKKKVDSQPAEESPPTNSSDLASQVKADEQNEKDLDQHDTLSQIQLQVLGESMPHHTGSGKTDAGADQKQSPVDNGTRTDNPFRKADSIETIGDKVISTNSEDGRFRRGQWSAEEEQLFIYSLENYGRDWKRMQELITTRDHRSIRSHAQKHLLRLQRRGLPLPDKVTLLLCSLYFLHEVSLVILFSCSHTLKHIQYLCLFFSFTLSLIPKDIFCGIGNPAISSMFSCLNLAAFPRACDCFPPFNLIT